MSNYQEFCEAFGGDANDPDFMDNWLDKYVIRDTKKSKNITKVPLQGDILHKGMIVHLVKLLAGSPSKPLHAIWNVQLKKDFSCSKGNYLKVQDRSEPGSWFIEKSFTVRSRKEGKYWYQIAFKETNSETYLISEHQKQYESLFLNKPG